MTPNTLVESSGAKKQGCHRPIERTGILSNPRSSVGAGGAERGGDSGPGGCSGGEHGEVYGPFPQG